MGPAKLRSVVKLRCDNKVLAFLTVVFLGFSLWLTTSSQLMYFDTTSQIELAVGLMMAAFTIVFFVTPMVYGHLLTSKMLILRYGVLHRMEIPLAAISSAEVVDSSTRLPLILGVGVRFSPFDKRCEILRSTNEVVKITLYEQMVLPGIISTRLVSEIMFDTVDSDKFMRSIEAA